MAKDRGVACEYYVCEGSCKIGREGTFFHYCQHCSKYKPIPGGKNIRPNRKKSIVEKFKRDKRNWE